MNEHGKWRYEFSKEAKKDFDALDGHQRKIVLAALEKVVQNPLPHSEGGYGIPLGNRHGFDLSNLLEIKLRGQNLRVIYILEHEKMVMLNIAIDHRADFEVYRRAFGRMTKRRN